MPLSIARLFAMAGALAAGDVAAADPAARCGSEEIASGVASTASDGRTFTLADGREIRLASIEVPATEGDAAGAAAKAALAALVLGQTVTLTRARPKGAASDNDRYARLLAHATVTREGAQRSVAAELLGQGHARLAARVEPRACAADLSARERKARAAKLGLWADPYYELRPAGKTAELLAERGRFTLVEGKVLSVRESGGTIYVNFGRRWSEDFTVTIPRRSERAFAEAGLVPKTLAGRTIVVRGWIEERGGPWIEAMRPEQIEIADRK